MAKEKEPCPEGLIIDSREECSIAVVSVLKSYRGLVDKVSEKSSPGGCFCNAGAETVDCKFNSLMYSSQVTEIKYGVCRNIGNCNFNRHFN